MKTTLFMLGLLLGGAAGIFLGTKSLEEKIILADDTTGLLELCEEQLPRSEVCLLVAIPENMLQGVPIEPNAPLASPPQRDFPLLFPPQIQEDEGSFR